LLITGILIDLRWISRLILRLIRTARDELILLAVLVRLILIRYTVGILARVLARRYVLRHVLRILLIRILHVQLALTRHLILHRRQLVLRQRLHAGPTYRLHHVAGGGVRHGGRRRVRHRGRSCRRRGINGRRGALDRRGAARLIHAGRLVQDTLARYHVLRWRHVLGYLSVSQPLQARLPEIRCKLPSCLLRQLGVLPGVFRGDVRQFGLPSRRRRPGDGDVGLLQGDLARPLSGVHRRLYPLAELGGSDQEEMLFLLAGDENVVLVLSLLLTAVPERRHAVAVLAIVEPLALVSQPVAPLGYAEAGSLVVLPLAKVRLGHRRVHLLVLRIDPSNANYFQAAHEKQLSISREISTSGSSGRKTIDRTDRAAREQQVSDYPPR